jgi:hypothetical protein
MSKSAKKKLKRNKSKMSTTSTSSLEDEEKSESGKEKSSNIGKGIREISAKTLQRSESAKEETSKIGKSIRKISTNSAESEEEMRIRRNFRRFNQEQKMSGVSIRETGRKSAPRGSQLLPAGGVSIRQVATEQMTPFLESSRSQSTDRQRPRASIRIGGGMESQQELMFLHKCGLI